MFAEASQVDAIDTQSLLMRCMGNVSFSLALLGELESTGDRRVKEIAAHVAARDWASAAEAAHSLKGSAGILFAEPLRAIAAEIESAGKSGNLDHTSSLVDDLRGEMARCLDAARLYRERSATASPCP